MHILRLITRFETSWTPADQDDELLGAALTRLEPFVTDGLVGTEPFRVHMTPEGRVFLRNICMAFDAHYWRKQPEGKLFSQAV